MQGKQSSSTVLAHAGLLPTPWLDQESIWVPTTRRGPYDALVTPCRRTSSYLQSSRQGISSRVKVVMGSKGRPECKPICWTGTT